MEVPTLEGLAPRKSMEPWIKDEVVFFPHQVQGARALARKKSFLLGDDMGLGKSLQSLTVFAMDVVRGWCTTAIVVAPISLKGNWADEIEKFSGFPYVLVAGSPAKRKKQILEFMEIEGPKILIVNYEQVVSHLSEFNKIGFDVAIFDEAHTIKNHKAKRTQACLALYSRRSFMLTGTPMLNHVNELWALLHRIDPNAYPDYWRFVNRYAVFGGYQDKQIIGVKNERELTDKLQAVMLRRLKSEVLDLPDVQIIERRVDMLPAQQKLYDEVINDMKLPRVGEEVPDDIENALTKFLRLKQICGTTLPFTGEDVSGKLDLVIEDDIEILENGNRTVVFTQFRDVISAYVARMNKARPETPIFEIHGGVDKDKRSDVVKQWANSKRPGVLVCNTTVAGVGLNMTAARHAAFIDKLFVPGLNQQAIDRLHRIGASETQPVQIREYLTRGSIEARVNQINKVKSKLFGEIVETDPDWKAKLVAAIRETEGL